MSNLKVVSDDEEFNLLLKGAGDDLIVIDFFTSWCRPCRTMEPVFEAMAIHYPKALFLKVDADKCFNTAMNYKVSGVPFFVIYFNKAVVETIQGANPQELELKIRLAEIECRKASAALELSNNIAPVNLNPVISTFGKLGSVTPYIDHENSHCLNDLSPTSFHNFLVGKRLISGRGTGKILLVYSFTQKMMLQSFKIKANAGSGPKVLRFFVNHPKVLDFNVGSTLAPSQEVTLNHHDLAGERAIELRSGSFQVVTNLQIFVTIGQSRSSKIEIDSLQLYGAPVLAMQPLLAADSIMAPTCVPSEVPTSGHNKSNSSAAAAAGTSCQACNRNQNENASSSPSDSLGLQCTVPQFQSHKRSSSNANNNEQQAGHSKNLIAVQNSRQHAEQEKETKESRHKERHNKDHTHHHSSASSHHHQRTT